MSDADSNMKSDIRPQVFWSLTSKRPTFNNGNHCGVFQVGGCTPIKQIDALKFNYQSIHFAIYTFCQSKIKVSFTFGTSQLSPGIGKQEQTSRPKILAHADDDEPK